MISRCLTKLDYMSCACGRAPSLMEVKCHGGNIRYRVEALCCQTQTVLLRTTQDAMYEFQRIRGVQYADRMKAEQA